jgi:hypothetical protein
VRVIIVPRCTSSLLLPSLLLLLLLLPLLGKP